MNADNKNRNEEESKNKRITNEYDDEEGEEQRSGGVVKAQV